MMSIVFEYNSLYYLSNVLLRAVFGSCDYDVLAAALFALAERLLLPLNLLCTELGLGTTALVGGFSFEFERLENDGCLC